MRASYGSSTPRLGVLSLLTAISVTLAACMGPDGATGPDGDDGDSYMSFTWAYVPNYLWLEDGWMPSTININQYYWTYANRYDYEYEAWDGSFWVGWYEVEYEPGQPGEPGGKGGPFGQAGEDGAPGADGRDLYFRLGLWSSGPTFTLVAAEYLVADASATEVAAHSAERALRSGLPSPQLRVDLPPMGEVQRQTHRLGRWRLTTEFRRVPAPTARREGRVLPQND